MQRFYAWLHDHPTLVDGSVAFVLGVFGLLGAVGLRGMGGGPARVLLFLIVVPLVWRRTHPVRVGVAVAAFGFGQVIFDVAPFVSDLAIVVALYTVAAYAPRRIARLGLVLGLVAPVLAVLRWGQRNKAPTGVNALLYYGVLVGVLAAPLLIAWVIGDNMRTRRAYLTELEDRAARLERERDTQAQVAAAAERARIARELHDVIAHNVSVMVVQADGAGYALDSSPEEARRALDTIATTGRQALAEMRRLLGVLRSAKDGSELAPQPGVEQLTDLLEQVRSAGLPVNFTVDGVPQRLPTGVALAAYRIVQEALTNTRKHAGPSATATVHLRYGDDTLTMEITDDGQGASALSDGLGHGLIGMRERVALFGGSLETGPCSPGGYRVAAVLPLRVPERGDTPAPRAMVG